MIMLDKYIAQKYGQPMPPARKPAFADVYTLLWRASGPRATFGHV